MAKSTRVKLPSDVLGTLRALLQTPPPPKGKKKAKKPLTPMRAKGARKT